MDIGKVLNERYKVIQYIGGGGMANVYLGEDLILGREVAIKLLKLEYSDHEEFIERFNREAESAISLSNDHIVNIFDVGQEDDLHYMIMEYVDGMTLKEYIQHKGTVSTHEAVRIMIQLSDAVEHAHDNGIIHRDIKPQNILMDHRGNVKITDFGIARALSSTSLTKTNDVMGSVHYLSPEQARGGTATRKSDIYSLGIVLYELLTGRLPFSGESAVSIALKHMQTEPPFVRSFNSEVPQSLENVVLKATVKNPIHRYATIEELRNSLETVFDHSRLNEERYNPPEEEGEDTKVIPAIQPNTSNNSTNEETIVPTQQNEKKKSKKWIAWVSSIVGILIAAFIIALFVLPGMFMPEDVTIPELEGYTYEEALIELSNIDLDVERESVFNDEVEEGYVIRTNPRSGTTVKEGSTVALYTSLGQEKIEFDDYVGQDFNETRRLLESRGYGQVREIRLEDERPEGEIINQIQPEPGEEIIPEDTRVIFEVSQGPPSISLPSFRDDTLERVQNFAQENELMLETEEEHSDDISEGRITRQEPSQNAELERGDEFKVYVSKGAEPQPITEQVSFTVTYDEEINSEDDEEEEPIGQEVQIFIEDQNNSINEVFEEDVIYEDTIYTVELTIEPDETGEVRVTKEGTLYYEEAIPYEPGED
ncbi:Stk1 family PASTA domain-containing Ser/Thr kinase [Alkalibacillus haloalkaliphilus]|uniref:Serine/threonine-protein kinase PrkC n=1 Tax=Alkalibacillus haloalkaliphilus TaxID=94136 RepID=A0A511W1G3_9BACI|nr:Stk1 family PASTA domain-containing Ser/Thr kinase [Alkalibacillus haloalkaliphilus]GEN44867.1 serine/threonine-protein kinase PrkC [Alkalibacillus haloalkaliphilus]